MSEELNTMTAEFYDELYGVDGDGLEEGEEAYKGEREYSYWLFSPYAFVALETAHKRGA